jgi:hypothetical protein
VQSNYSTHFRAQAPSGTCDRKVLERREGPDGFGVVASLVKETVQTCSVTPQPGQSASM